MLATVVLLGLTLVAAVTDLLWNKIYNWNTYGGIAGGAWRLSAAAHGCGWIGSPLFAATRWLGRAAGVCCGLLMIVCFIVLPRHRRRRREADGHARRTARMGKGHRSHAVDLRAGGLLRLIGLIWKVGPLTAVGRVCG